MKTQVIAGAIILGLGAVTMALAQPGTVGVAPRPSAAEAPATRSGDKPRDDCDELHSRVARLRAEVELLQLEHGLAKERLSAGLKERDWGVENTPRRQAARDLMRIGAELVGKGSEFEAAMQEKGGEVWKAVTNAVAETAPADIGRLKQDFVRVATDLNRKKIDLIALEVRLEGSM